MPPTQWPKTHRIDSLAGGIMEAWVGGLKLHTHVGTFMQRLNETAASVLLQRWEGPSGNPSEATCQ